MKVNVYVDGFNLYYRALDRRANDGSTNRWLNLHELATKLLPPPKYEVQLIRYFTAHVRVQSHDAYSNQRLSRQQTYLRALRTLPNITVHLGHFMPSQPTAKLVTPLSDGTKYVTIHKSEEKGSDVNLATYLLLDGFRNEYDCAAVITNDSDQVEAVKVVRDELKKPIGVLDPCGEDRTSRELMQVSTFYKPIRQGVIAASQFAPQLLDVHGTFHKPDRW